MDHDLHREAHTARDADLRWMHDLRNVAGVLGSGVVLSRRLIEKGRADEAVDVLVEAERALREFHGLLDRASRARRFEAEAVGPDVRLDS